MATASSRRRYLRLKVEGVALWRLAQQPQEAARRSGLRDLSLKGFSLVTDEELEMEAPLAFELNLKDEKGPPLCGEAVVAWWSRNKEADGGTVAGVRFSAVKTSEVLAYLLDTYPNNPELHASLCANVQFCSDAEKGRCPAYQAGKNCWELVGVECCATSRSECCECPYAALAFLI